MTPQEFIAQISASAVQSMKSSRIPASFTVAEAALESGWGSSRLYAEAKNIFGVKADPSWDGPFIDMPTHEYVNGRLTQVMARWRKYDTYQACFDEHAKFLHDNERYGACFERQYTGPEFAIEIARCGYSTDPDYAEKMASIIRQHNLMELDHD